MGVSSVHQAGKEKEDGASILNIRMIKVKLGKRRNQYRQSCLFRLRIVKKVVLT